MNGRASSPTRTGRSAMKRCSRRSPTGCARSSATRSPTRCSTTSGRGRCRRRGEADALGLRFALARREIEAEWGVANLEVPLGLVCQTDSFLWFASHLLAQLPRYQQVHNDCLAEYRAAHRIRSRHHPGRRSRQDRTTGWRRHSGSGGPSSRGGGPCWPVSVRGWWNCGSRARTTSWSSFPWRRRARRVARSSGCGSCPPSRSACAPGR